MVGLLHPPRSAEALELDIIVGELVADTTGDNVSARWPPSPNGLPLPAPTCPPFFLPLQVDDIVASWHHLGEEVAAILKKRPEVRTCLS